MAREAHDTRLLTRALTNLNADWTHDDARRAAEFGREAVAASRTIGDLSWVSSGVVNLCLATLVSGEWDEAIALLDEDVLDGLDFVHGELVRCQINTARQQPYTPTQAFESLVAEEDLSMQACRKAVRARIALASGDPGVAELAVEAARTMYAQAGIFDDFTVLWQMVTDVVWEAGDRSALDELFAIVSQAKRDNKLPTGLRAQQSRLLGLMAIEDGADPTTVEAHLQDGRRRVPDLERGAHVGALPGRARCLADPSGPSRRGRRDAGGGTVDPRPARRPRLVRAAGRTARERDHVRSSTVPAVVGP